MVSWTILRFRIVRLTKGMEMKWDAKRHADGRGGRRCETDSDELVLKRKPLNNIVRRSRASHQLRCIIEELAAKVRLVVCGNWKKGATPHAPENQSLNRAEAIRIAASLLAQVELTCWCETWEATALEALVQALSSRRILDMEAMEL
eukprot:s237_g4.t1